MKILIIIIAILIPTFGSGQVGVVKPVQLVDMTTLAAVQYDTTKLEADLVTLGTDRTKASKIQEYFTNGKIMMEVERDGKRVMVQDSFLNYQDEWINLVMYSIEELNIKSFGGFQNKEELIKKFNYLIGEHAKVVAIKVK